MPRGDDDQEGSRAASSRRSGAGTRTASRVESLFPLLRLLEGPVNVSSARNVIYLGILADAIQQIGFVINPHFSYDMTIPKELSFFAFSLHVPIWDSTISSVGYTGFVVWYWISALVVLLLSGFITAVIFQQFELKKNAISSFFKSLIHLTEAILAVPMMHSLSAHMFCYRRRLWAFPEEKCWEVATTAYFCVSLVLLVLLTVICFLVRTSLFDDSVFSRHPLARAHGRLDVLVTAQRLLQVLFFHLLLGPGWKSSYCFFALLLNAFAFAGYAFVCPYYNVQMTQLKCATHMAVFVAATVSFASTYLESTFGQYHVSSQWLVVAVPFGAVLGYYIGGLRVADECKERLWHLKQYGEVYCHPCYFPCGLPANDVLLTQGMVSLSSLERDILQREAHVDPEESTEPETSIDVLVPYIRFITMDSDVELATRFLREHSFIAGRVPDVRGEGAAAHPPAQMLAFGARIFIKAVVKWKSSPVVRLHFAHFIMAYCPASKYMFALEQCEEALHGGEMLGIRYQAFKLHSRIRSQLGMHDRTHRFSLERARRFHKNALSDMVNFWSRLMDGKTDIMNLAAIANQITEKRDRGHQEYKRAIRDSPQEDRVLLQSYAGFLENVMFETKQAEMVRQRANELGEQMRQQIIGGKSVNMDTASSISDTRRMLLQGNQSEDSMGNTSNAARMLSLGILASSILLALLTLGSFMCAYFNTLKQKETINKIHDGGMTRTLVQIAGHEVGMLERLIDTTFDSQETHEGRVYAQQEKLRKYIAQFNEYNNKLTYGQYKSQYAPLVNWYRGPKIALTDFHDPSQSSATESVVVVGLWSAAQYIVAALHDIAMIDANNSQNGVNTRFVTRRPIRFILENVPTKAAWAFNETLTLLEEEDSMNADWTVVGLSLSFAIVILTIIVVNALVALNFEKIAVTKIVALHLFSLIPYTVQEQLYRSAKDKVIDLDRQTREEEQGTEQLDTGMLSENEEDEEPDKDGTSSLGESMRKQSVYTGQRHGMADSSSKRIISVLKTPHRNSIATKKKKKKKRVRFNLEGLAPTKGVIIAEKLSEPPPEVAPDEEGLLTKEERRELLALDEDQSAGAAAAQDVADKKQARAQAANQRTGILQPMITVIVLTLAAVGLLVSVTLQGGDLENAQRAELMFVSNFTEYVTINQEMRWYAASMALMGYESYWSSYWNAKHDQKLMRLRREMMLVLDEVEAVAFAKTERDHGVLEHTEKIALALLARSYSLPSTLAAETKLLQWTPANPEYERYASVVMRRRDYGYTNSDKDLSQDSQRLRDHAREILTSDRYYADYDIVVDQGSKVRHTTLDRLKDTTQTRQESYEIQVIVTIVLFFGIAASVITPVPNFRKPSIATTGGGFVWVLWQRPSLRKPPLFGLLFMMCLTSIVCFSLLFQLRVDMDHMKNANEEALQSGLLRNETLGTLVGLETRARRYVTMGDQLQYLDYWQFRDENDLGRLWNESQQFKGNDAVLADQYLLDAQIAANEVLRQHVIAFALMGWAIGEGWGDLRVQLPQRPEQLQTVWNHASEDSYSTDLLIYQGDKPEWKYNNTVWDSNRTTVDKVNVARHTLFSERYNDFHLDAVAKLNRYFRHLERGAEDEANSKADTVGVLELVALVLGCVTLLSQAVLAVLLGTYSIEIDFEHSNLQNTSRDMFAGLTWRCRIAYVVIILLLGTQFILGITNARRSIGSASQLNAATKREWAVARSALYADHLYSAYSRGSAAEGDKRRVLEMVDDLVYIRNDLYFGSSDDPGYRGAGGNSAQDDSTFATDGVDGKYTKWMDNLRELVRAVEDDVQSQNVTSSPAAQQTGGLVATRATAQDIYLRLQDSLDVLISGLWTSGLAYRDASGSTIDDNNVYFIAVTCVMLAVIFIEYQIVFRPVIEQLTDEENGTKALLKMIPRQVRELVPKIAAYLDHGVMVDETQEPLTYHRCDVVQGFIVEFSKLESDNARNLRMLDNSKYCVVVADDVGVIIYANVNFATCFPGYTPGEMVGQNVSVLVPEALAVHHARFMEAYRLTGIARVVGGGRDVLGVDKNGQLNHIYIQLYECRRGEQVYFIAQFQRYELLDQELRNAGINS
eukprot:Hpha_TRINITY_DN15564_c3_g6::TRINITY_DN15564_c3_g6_i1::g.107834::m.107834